MRVTTKIMIAGAALLLASAPAPRAHASAIPSAAVASLFATPPAPSAVAALTVATVQDAKIDISVNEKRGGAWYTNPVWIAIGIIALVLIIVLIAMAGRGRDTTVIK
jgi:hypothetical protein